MLQQKETQNGPIGLSQALKELKKVRYLIPRLKDSCRQGIKLDEVRPGDCVDCPGEKNGCEDCKRIQVLQ